MPPLLLAFAILGLISIAAFVGLLVYAWLSVRGGDPIIDGGA